MVLKRRPWPWLVALAVVMIPAIASAATNCNNDFDEARARGWLWMYLAAFGFGFQTSLTPCVYPMIPITLGIFGARGKDVPRRRAIALATSYVVGMGITYAAFGVIVAMFGGQFGTQLANPYFVVPIVVLLLALAASMFGAFELNLPASWQAKLSQVGGRGFKGAFAMGMVGGLVAAPCTGPFLLGLLTYVATTRSVVVGGSLLFIYALGMGVLFFVLAAFAISLPKSGRWMEWVKSAGGILLLLASLYFLSPIVSALRHVQNASLVMLLGSLGLAVVGFGIGAVQLSFHGPFAEKLRKGFGVLLVTAGLFGAWSWYLAPKQELDWQHDEAKAFALAAKEHKGVMIDFGASWCGACHELEGTFADVDVYKAITENFIPLQFDVSEDTAQGDDERARFDAVGPLPAVRYVTADKQPLAHVDQYLEADALMKVLDTAISGLHGGTTSEPCK